MVFGVYGAELRGTFRGSGVSFPGGYLKEEPGSSTGLALHPYPSAVSLKNGLADSQTQSASAVSTSPATVSPIEPVKDPFLIFGGDTRSIIPHLHNSVRAYEDSHRAVLRTFRSAAGIVQKVEQNLADQRRVPRDIWT